MYMAFMNVLIVSLSSLSRITRLSSILIKGLIYQSVVQHVVRSADRTKLMH